MKKLTITTVLTLAVLFTGCQTPLDQEEAYQQQFEDMCSNPIYQTYDICKPKEQLKYSKINQISEIEEIAGFLFKYTSDENGEDWSIGTGDILNGDCEDWSFTFVNLLLETYNLQKDTVRITAGTSKDAQSGHMWTEITIEGQEYIFSNNYPFGVAKDVADYQRDYPIQYQVKRF